MLQSLRVKNLAIVENVEVEFQSGLNIITGETGAGKSILIDALGLVLGERADRSMIRAGESQSSIEAVFSLEDTARIDVVLDRAGLDPCSEGELIVRRVISASGAGRNFVNDATVTLQVLKGVGNLLVDMHGAHDHQSLLSSAYQLEVLDAYAGLGAERASYHAEYRSLLDQIRERGELEGDDEQIARQIDMLAYQVKEIQDAGLSAQEAIAVDEEHTVVANAQAILESARRAIEGLTDGDNSAFDTMAGVMGALEELSQVVPDASTWREDARTVSVQIQELCRSLEQYAGRVDGDPARLQWLEERKSLYENLKRKYGDSVESVLAFLGDAENRLEQLQARDERLADVDQRIQAQEQRLRKSGSALSADRNKASTRLGEAITKALRDLGFSEGAFNIALQCCDPGPTGTDGVEYMFAPNVGEGQRPLRSIASSGEISRVMLATKSVLAGHDRVPVLIFDEIDANLGGEIGNAVGVRLAAVAGSHQVICITHLPQVAVHGTTHLAVRKDIKKNRTYTKIEELKGTHRSEEIARMLAGDEASRVALKHARELLKSASA